MHKHQVAVNGVTFSRNSKTRQYTHAVAAIHLPSGDPVVLAWTALARPEAAFRQFQRSEWCRRQWGKLTAVPNGAEITL